MLSEILPSLIQLAPLQLTVHTVNLHHVQDKFYRQTRQLLLKLLEGQSLQQVTLYNVWLSDANLGNLLSLCAGLPTREPEEVVEVIKLFDDILPIQGRTTVIKNTLKRNIFVVNFFFLLQSSFWIESVHFI